MIFYQVGTPYLLLTYRHYFCIYIWKPHRIKLSYTRCLVYVSSGRRSSGTRCRRPRLKIMFSLVSGRLPAVAVIIRSEPSGGRALISAGAIVEAPPAALLGVSSLFRYQYYLWGPSFQCFLSPPLGYYLSAQAGRAVRATLRGLDHGVPRRHPDQPKEPCLRGPGERILRHY